MKQTQNFWENLILLDTPWATAPLGREAHWLISIWLAAE